MGLFLRKRGKNKKAWEINAQKVEFRIRNVLSLYKNLIVNRSILLSKLRKGKYTNI